MAASTTSKRITAHDTHLSAFTRDDADCGIALNRLIATEVYYGMNLATVLSHVHNVDPELFAQMQTIFNLAHNCRQ